MFHAPSHKPYTHRVSDFRDLRDLVFRSLAASNRPVLDSFVLDYTNETANLRTKGEALQHNSNMLDLLIRIQCDTFDKGENNVTVAHLTGAEQRGVFHHIQRVHHGSFFHQQPYSGYMA